MSAAELAARLAAPAPPLVLDVRAAQSGGGGGGGDALSGADAAAAAAIRAAAVRVPLSALSDAVRAGRLEAGRAAGVVCVCDTGAAAAQARRLLRARKTVCVC